jgi:hypothetical protein
MAGLPSDEAALVAQMEYGGGPGMRSTTAMRESVDADTDRLSMTIRKTTTRWAEADARRRSLVASVCAVQHFPPVMPEAEEVSL